MKAIGYMDAGPISVENALIELEIDVPPLRSPKLQRSAPSGDPYPIRRPPVFLSSVDGRGRDRGVVEAQARIVEETDVLGEEAADGGEADAFVHRHLRVAIDDDLVEAAVGGEDEAAVGADLQAEAAVEEAEAGGAQCLEEQMRVADHVGAAEGFDEVRDPAPQMGE